MQNRVNWLAYQPARAHWTALGTPQRLSRNRVDGRAVHRAEGRLSLAAPRSFDQPSPFGCGGEIAVKIVKEIRERLRIPADVGLVSDLDRPAETPFRWRGTASVWPARSAPGWWAHVCAR